MAAGTPAGPRRMEVAARRVERWAEAFEARHGPVRIAGSPEAVTLTASDGALARLTPLAPNDRWASSLGEWAAYPQVIGLVLVRRGGYAVGLAVGDRLAAHKVGSRYVQSRTAAGGWSQQRFARRRANQADALVEAVAEHAARLVLPGSPGALVIGGDRRLVAEVLAEPVLASLPGLPRRELFDLPDPNRAVLEQALARGRSAAVSLVEPEP